MALLHPPRRQLLLKSPNEVQVTRMASKSVVGGRNALAVRGNFAVAEAI